MRVSIDKIRQALADFVTDFYRRFPFGVRSHFKRSGSLRVLRMSFEVAQPRRAMATPRSP